MTSSKSRKQRSDKGTVQIKLSHSRLQLVFRVAGQRYYLSTGFADSPTNRKSAEMKARQIELDVVSGNFDDSLAKYKIAAPARKAEPITPKITPKIQLDNLWEQYTEFKRPSLSPNTLSKEFATAERCIEQLLPTRDLDEAVQIRDWIVANKPPNAAKRLLIQLAACCEWAQKSGLIEGNPFTGMAAEVKLPKSTVKRSDQEIDPFTVEERDAIIQAFATGRYQHYTAFIGFLFRTGCRPSEAIALQWKHVSQDFGVICFEAAVIWQRGGLSRRKGLKTQDSRKFPVNASLRSLLQAQRQANPGKLDDLVFPSPDGRFIDFHNFRNRAWKTVLDSLPLVRYRKPYQTRHTANSNLKCNP